MGFRFTHKQAAPTLEERFIWRGALGENVSIRKHSPDPVQTVSSKSACFVAAGGAVDTELLAASSTERQSDGTVSPGPQEIEHDEPLASRHGCMHAHQSARKGGGKDAVPRSDPQGSSSHLDLHGNMPRASSGLCGGEVQAVSESPEGAQKSEKGLVAEVRRRSGGATLPAVDRVVAEKLQSLGVGSSHWNGTARDRKSDSSASCKRESRESDTAPGWRPPKTGTSIVLLEGDIFSTIF